MRLEFIGGASTVTGSCFNLRVNNLNFLVDCGMHQGNGGESETLDRKAFPFDPAKIDFVFVTHAHMDHSGMLPRLKREGFKGKIFTTQATKDLLKPMLVDSARIQQSDADWQTRKAARAGLPPIEPLYTEADVAAVLPMFEQRDYAKLYHLGSGVKYRFIDAGHILGSATLELWFQDSEREKKIVFSGDIGKKGNPILKDPSMPDEADYVVMESTYGNRLHRPLRQSVDELASAIKTTFKRGGNVYIPTFALGRTQDILYILNGLAAEGRLFNINVHLDSPLAEEATKIYLAHPECFDEEAKKLFEAAGRNGAPDKGKSMFSSMKTGALKLHFTHTVDESMLLNRLKSGHIIMAGSGMCEGGRIKHHLKHNLWRRECSVVFVGFQARGTLGRRIVDGAKTVSILGEEIAVRAQIHTINGFSAHADRHELFEWLTALSNSPKVFLVHGEEEAAESLGKFIQEKTGLETHRPRDGEVVEL
ncbi:MAG: MBL fold metallo-hydrolase [Deltaproteobacteria bacterium]|nr:MBL fold metallo-hydrolase [Deltaproteobacteria bacterium]